MANRGRPPKLKNPDESNLDTPRKRGRPKGSAGKTKPSKWVEPMEIKEPEKLKCTSCDRLFETRDYYKSNSVLNESVGRVPYCKECIDKFYQKFLKKYKAVFEQVEPERKAIERVCMVLDVYYSDSIFDAAEKESKDNLDTPLIWLYMKHASLIQYYKKSYDDTIFERYQEAKNARAAMSVFTEQDFEQGAVLEKAVKFFGSGFSNEDYIFLQEQYDDWTTRHECETKSQEEVFKQICFTQLELLKATRAGQDTKGLNDTFLKQLEAAKLQPKQNKGETAASNQTFGTLIDKWENTRPIPEIDEDLKDVDKIGLYLDVFFRGHLAKMMGLKNGLSNLYTKFMKKYTVERPEYADNSDGEALFDVIFGKAGMDETSPDDEQ